MIDNLMKHGRLEIDSHRLYGELNEGQCYAGSSLTYGNYIPYKADMKDRLAKINSSSHIAVVNLTLRYTIPGRYSWENDVKRDFTLGFVSNSIEETLPLVMQALVVFYLCQAIMGKKSK